MNTYDVAVIPGDGVGREVADEGLKILDAVADKFGFRVKTVNYDWGCNYYLKYGAMNPADMLVTLKDFDAIFLGCIGDAGKVPDHVSLSLLLEIRKGFDQYVNLRPIRLYPGIQTPVRTATSQSVDFVVVRENTEGEYSRVGGFFKSDTPDAFALQTGVFTRKGCSRVMDYAFQLARERKMLGVGQTVGRVTIVLRIWIDTFFPYIFKEMESIHVLCTITARNQTLSITPWSSGTKFSIRCLPAIPT
ncbi:hypothetical protein DSCO28_57860 [Desulfosarcina ovata subsp. sediminis]|uniref:Isopropylmalate dehydrogenase-like domain-containing protein n=1 Tax=Desulfosarcina ovata subsp. sediminis TaxID=885957 RepID=A0A5K7ZYQ2_9BACT|nr:isocitrate/isopropylmalate family dehydrogenase [Desulfosarcina ovata]BBO85220.1 hypothetical protein DSCO28_57860 [Desulfosarcina ovata subsp. sediminis]